jgi:hypothetical protein
VQPYEAALSGLTAEVSFGYTKIHVYRPPELELGQVGYSVTPTGLSLAGEGDGDWRKNWLVIGYDETCGDPIFIDISKKAYPVYTAIMGRGRWDPQPVAISLEAFTHSLSALRAVAKGREYPALLEKNPLTLPEKEGVLEAIRYHNPGMDLSYWEAILDSS